jgi:hypothetical protein
VDTVTDSLVEDYVRLGLRLDRHVEGTVDAYFGPSAYADAVKAEPLRDPAALVAEADKLLNALDDGWLRDQVVGLRAYAAVLAGEQLSYSDEVEACYGVRPSFTDESVFAEAHDVLDGLLPGTGSLDERHERWYNAMLLPPERIERTLTAVIAEARRQTAALVPLPEGDSVELELMTDVPWQGFNFYQGDLKGRIAASIERPMTAWGLLILALHETYPGHQAELACKEQLLFRDRGILEASIVLAPTPQAVVAEGIGCLAPYLLLEGGQAQAFAAIVAEEAGVTFDLAEAVAIARASEPCRWADVNAALMLYERGAGDAATQDYLVRWGVMAADKAEHLVRFIREPASRTYIANYPTGFGLCEGFTKRHEDGLRRLLTEQLRIADLH